MNAMQTDPRSLRVLDGAVRLAWYALVAVTVMVVALGTLVVIGDGSLHLDGSTETVEPLRSESGDDVSSRNGDEGSAGTGEGSTFVSADGTITLGRTDVQIAIDDDQILIRAVAMAVVVCWLLLAWGALIHLRPLVRSLRAGEGFRAANARRIRWLGAVIVTYPVVTLLGQLVLRQLVDRLDLSGPAVTVDVGVSSWWVWIVLGLLMLGLSGLVERGVELQQLDEATV